MALFFNCSSSSKIGFVRTFDERLKELQYLILERDFDFYLGYFLKILYYNKTCSKSPKNNRAKKNFSGSWNENVFGDFYFFIFILNLI